MSAIIKTFRAGAVAFCAEHVRQTLASSKSVRTQTEIGAYMGIGQSAVSKQIRGERPFTVQHSILYPVFYGLDNISIVGMSSKLLSFAINHVLHDKKQHGFSSEEEGEEVDGVVQVTTPRGGFFSKKGLTKEKLDQIKVSNAPYVDELISLYNSELINNAELVKSILEQSALHRNKKADGSELRNLLPEATDAQFLAHCKVGIETLTTMHHLRGNELFKDLLEMKGNTDG